MSLYNIYKNNDGFSLVETLVAITILLLVVVGPLTISSRTAKSATFASEQVVAQFLAQEGVELAQKMRDDVLLGSVFLGTAGGTTWNNFTGTPNCFTATGCGLEIAPDGASVVVKNCAASVTTCLLYLNTTAGVRAMYTHTTTSGTTATPYTRTIKMTATGNQEVRVESIVTWRTGSIVASQQVKVESALFNTYGI